MQNEFPAEFGAERWDVDVDLLFVEALNCLGKIYTPERYFHG